MMNLPPIICHRGASSCAPENTLAAFRKAHALGGQWVEFDVQLTRDRQLVVIHDEKINRTTNGAGVVSTLDYAEIATLDAGQWFAAEYTDERVPTLDAVLQCCADLNLGINIEIKNNSRAVASIIAEGVVASLARHWRTDLPLPLISSFYQQNLLAVYALTHRYPLGFCSSRWLPFLTKRLQRLHCSSIHANHQSLTPARVTAARRAGFYVLAYTVNERNRAEMLLSWGVNALFSNYPDLLA